MSKLVEAAVFLNLTEAHIFRDLLAEQDIECFIFGEQLQVLIRLPTLGIRVMVRAADRPRARELLRELEAAEIPVREL